MSLDISKLEKVVRRPDGGYVARCPACFEIGQDKKGNHLKIWPDGRFGCCVANGDHQHRSRIWAMAKNGDSSPAKAYRAPVPAPKPVPIINSGRLLREWATSTKKDWIERLAKSLGVSVEALSTLEPVWAAPHRAWAFGMRDGDGNLVGIRLRSENGDKWAVTGSRQGLFIPNCSANKTLFVVEGPTDLAAALTLGLWGIGRPSCSGGMDLILSLVRRLKPSRAVLCSDNDEPGVRGAENLANHLPIPSCMFCPPSKDLRSFLQSGGTSELIDCLLAGVIWKQPKKEY